MGSFSKRTEKSRTQALSAATSKYITVKYGFILAGSVPDLTVTGDTFSVPVLTFNGDASKAFMEGVYDFRQSSTDPGFQYCSLKGGFSYNKTTNSHILFELANGNTVIGYWDPFRVYHYSWDFNHIEDLQGGITYRSFGLSGTASRNFLTPTLSTSSFFNTSNKTSKTVNLNVNIKFLNTPSSRSDNLNFLFQGNFTYGPRGGTSTYNDRINQEQTRVKLGVNNAGTLTLTLNAPPTFTTGNVYFDTSYPDGKPYAKYSTASIDVTSATAKYGGDIVSVTFKIGSQQVARSTAGTLSIPLQYSGEFEPVVEVVDSRGQKTERKYPKITVAQYVPPIMDFTADRTLQSGVPDDENGTYATISLTYNWMDYLENLIAPVVERVDDNGVKTTAVVNWYSNRDASGVLSGTVDWSSLTSPCTVYGLISGFNIEHSYDLLVTPKDTGGTGNMVSRPLPTAYYTIDFLAGGRAIAFGKSALREGFECAMDVTFDNDFYLNINTNAASGVDHDIYQALVDLNWTDLLS